MGIQKKYSQKHQGQKGWDNKDVRKRPVQKGRDKMVCLSHMLTNRHSRQIQSKHQGEKRHGQKGWTKRPGTRGQDKSGK